MQMETGLEQAVANAQVIATTKVANDAFKNINMDIDQVEDVIEENQEMMDMQVSTVVVVFLSFCLCFCFFVFCDFFVLVYFGSRILLVVEIDIYSYFDRSTPIIFP